MVGIKTNHLGGKKGIKTATGGVCMRSVAQHVFERWLSRSSQTQAIHFNALVFTIYLKYGLLLMMRADTLISDYNITKVHNVEKSED